MKTIWTWFMVALLAGSLAACGGDGDGPGVAVAAAPTITTAPAAATVTAGQTATFSVTATGDGTLSYQWQVNGTDIAGATAATYTTAATLAADTGKSYTVKVSNAGGTTSSAAAVLTVNPVAATTVGDNVATATDLATEAKAAIAAAEKKALLPGPFGVNLQGALPFGAAFSSACGAGGTFSYDYPTAPVAGTTYSMTYNNCSFLTGYLFNGSITITFSSYTSESNFNATIVYNLSYTGAGLNESFAGTATCSFNGDYDCVYSDSGRTFEHDFSYESGTINGRYDWSYSTYGSYVFTFNQWTATSGSVTITGPNGFTATIVRNGATSFTVTINGGTAYAITIAG